MSLVSMQCSIFIISVLLLFVFFNQNLQIIIKHSGQTSCKCELSRRIFAAICWLTVSSVNEFL